MAKCAAALTRPTCHPRRHTPAEKPSPACFGVAFTEIPWVSFPAKSLPLVRASRSTGGRNCDRGLGQSRLSLTPSQTTWRGHTWEKLSIVFPKYTRAFKRAEEPNEPFQKEELLRLLLGRKSIFITLTSSYQDFKVVLWDLSKIIKLFTKYSNIFKYCAKSSWRFFFCTILESEYWRLICRVDTSK